MSTGLADHLHWLGQEQYSIRQLVVRLGVIERQLTDLAVRARSSAEQSLMMSDGLHRLLPRVLSQRL